MTVYGGEETAWGTKKDGFYVVCCKCGWESKVNVYAAFIEHASETGVVFECGRCENTAEVV
jgi:hypothetical protein